MRPNYLISLLVITLLNSCDREPVPIKNSHYYMELSIYPSSQIINVKGDLLYKIEEQTDSISFFVHRNIRFKDLELNGKTNYKLFRSPSNIRWLPDAYRITLVPKGSFRSGETAHLEFHYHAAITEWPSWSANVITKDWIELGGYFPWYPKIDGMYTYDLKVDIDPEYHVFAEGNISHLDEQIQIQSHIPKSEIIICAAKDLQIHKVAIDDKHINLVNTNLSELSIKEIASALKKLFQVNTETLGPIDTKEISLVISKREKGGGYARESAIYLGGITDEKFQSRKASYFKYLAHEFSHLWWNNPHSNWEDWINEGLAEFTALRIVRSVLGDKAYEDYIHRKTENSENTPPIWELDRSHEKAYAVLYSKSVILLHQLEQHIGQAAMSYFLQQLYKQNIHTTEDLLNMLQEQTDKETRDKFEWMLKND